MGASGGGSAADAPGRAHADIRVGTLVQGEHDAAGYIRQVLPHGFESFELTFYRHLAEGIDLDRIAGDVGAALAGSGAVVSALGVYGNAILDERTRESWARLIDAAGRFGCGVVCGFAGAIRGASVPDVIPHFARVFRPLAQRAADVGVCLAFENCEMGGTWEDSGNFNIAHAPPAWELMLEALHELENVGLEWEPCHQLCALADPMAQLAAWSDRIFHIHGKDASIDRRVLAACGLRGGQRWAHHRTPGFGDTNWTDVISHLRMRGWRGAIDIEGWHDPVYREALEMTGQVRALRYLKECRGGVFVPNPTVVRGPRAI